MQIQHMHQISVQKLDGHFAAQVITRTVLWLPTGHKFVQGMTTEHGARISFCPMSSTHELSL